MKKILSLLLTLSFVLSSITAFAQSDNSSDGASNDYTVAFIGGSLTAGGSLWIEAVRENLQKKMPDKNIVTINAGKGGTTSLFGAARFSEDILPYEPDLLFIEFAVNDTEFADVNYSKIYMESMLNQCKTLSKEPVVIFLYAPYPVTKDTDTYKKWLSGVEMKEGLAQHYGIKSINIYDYMQRDYENIKSEKNYNDFNDYLKPLYNASGSGFDVHGGYQKYAEAIVEALDNDFEGCMSPMKKVDIYSPAYKKTIEARYKQIGVTDQELKFTGNWDIYTANNKFSTSDSKITINASNYSYPYFTDGIAQLLNKSGELSFETKAEAISINYITATAGSGAKVYVDEKETTSITCRSVYHAMNYNTQWISLPSDGKTHNVKIVVDAPTDNNYVFRFGTIMERYPKDENEEILLKDLKITQCEADQKTDDVKVCVEGFVPNTNAAVLVTNPNEDLAGAAENFDLSSVQYTDTVTADEQGIVKFTFNTRVENEDRSGGYTLYISDEYGRKVSKAYNYGIVSAGKITYKNEAGDEIEDIAAMQGKKVIMLCTIVNGTDKDIAPNILTAFYKNGGELFDVSMNTSNSVLNNSSNEVKWEVTVPNDMTSISQIKVMFIDSMLTLKPLTRVRCIYEKN